MNDTRPQTFRLQRYFSIASGVLMLAVALPLSYAYYLSEVNEHTTLAGLRNASLAKTYANALWPVYGSFLLREDLATEVRKGHDLTQELDKRIREMAEDVPVTKIKVYNLKGIAAYSSVLREIGEDKSLNQGFMAASQGRLINELAHRGTMSATEGEIQNVDVVSTYIPIQPSDSEQVVAVFELYSNVTETVAHIQVVALRLLLVLGAVFLVLYLSLLKIVARADRILQKQYLDLKYNESRLQSKTQELEQEIQERRDIEKALRQSEEVAASASRAKSEFLSSMSHELRTPMNAILGFTQLLETEPNAPLSDNQQRFSRQIMKSGAHLLGLIDQILDLSRIEAGKISLSLEHVSLQALMDETLPMVQHLATQRQLACIDVAVADFRVIADYGRLKQVILNLLSNAIKYNRSGGSISVSAMAQGQQLRVAVTDSGLGIPPERLCELFQPFNRLGVDSTEVEGTGIGLALSKHMVEAMDGTIGVDSEPGVGSTFWITLPMVPHETSMLAAEGEQVSRPDAGSDCKGQFNGSFQHRRVLYIEDNPANVTLMEELTKRLDGLTLITAHTAEIGLALAATETPDLIVMDINLPGMDGFAALQKLQSEPTTEHIPVIALTANAMPSDIKRGRSAGFHSYLTKPMRIDELTHAMSQALKVHTHADI